MFNKTPTLTAATSSGQAVASQEEISEIVRLVLDNQLRDVVQQVAKISETVAKLEKAQAAQMGQTSPRVVANAAPLTADPSLLPAD